MLPRALELLRSRPLRLDGREVEVAETPLRARVVLDDVPGGFRLRLHPAASAAERFVPGIALRDGVIVPWQVRDWTGDQVPLDDACSEMIASAEGPGIVNAVSIRDAENFARRLKRDGIAAAAVHSELPRARLNARSSSRCARGPTSTHQHLGLDTRVRGFGKEVKCQRKTVGGAITAPPTNQRSGDPRPIADTLGRYSGARGLKYPMFGRWPPKECCSARGQGR